MHARQRHHANPLQALPTRPLQCQTSRRRRRQRLRPPVDNEDGDDLYAQPQARLAHLLALDGVVEPPSDVRALLAQGLRSIYDNDNEHIELPEAMERAFCAAIDTKVVPSDAEPKSYCDAMHHPDSGLWHQAMVRKMEAHLENGTWELVKLPHPWLQVGLQGEAQPRRHRRALQSPPHCQRLRPASRRRFRRDTLRAILALAALENLKLELIDISNAYLNGALHDVDVCMQQPDGFAERNSTWVARLLKGLYGLKQGGREWFHRLGEVLVELGFAHIRSDSTVFIWEKDGVKVIVPVFMDNITLASKLKEKIARSRACSLSASSCAISGPPRSSSASRSSTRSAYWITSASIAAPSPRCLTPARASTCPSARRRL
jgi:hypothetical protein